MSKNVFGISVTKIVILILLVPIAGANAQQTITNLTNASYNQIYIKWVWNDPINPNFSKVMVYLDGKFKTNVTKGIQLYNSTGLLPNTSHTISTRTVDINGNINLAWANKTARTAPVWTPLLNTSWQWQLTGTINQSYNVTMYDIDMFDNNAITVSSLQHKGRKVICYISVGSWENWRPDANQFPSYVLGNYLNGYPDERWLDIRRIDILGPIMRNRMDLCKEKGFDGVEPDNIDGYTNNPGFPFTYQDQLKYNKFVAQEAHKRGLSVGMKNDLDQISDLINYFDWSLDEQCFEYAECDLLKPFITNKKAVFEVEYNLNPINFCPQANQLNFNSMKKHDSLDSWRQPCRGP